MTITAGGPVTVSDLVAAVREQQDGGAAHATLATSVTPETPPRTASPSLLVVASHAGAGATAVSVALADALAAALSDATGRSAREVHLIDGAPTERSGMLAATDRDMANVGSSWRMGRRKAVRVLRPVHSMSPSDLPPLPPCGADLVVTDSGTDWRTLTSTPSPLWPPEEGVELVVVFRATVPGACQVERALAALPGNPYVVGVGAKRWPSSVAAAFGPRLGSARIQGRVALFPADRRLELNGIDTEPFSKPLAGAAAQLIERIWPDITGTSANQTTHQNRKGLRR